MPLRPSAPHLARPALGSGMRTRLASAALTLTAAVAPPLHADLNAALLALPMGPDPRQPRQTRFEAYGIGLNTDLDGGDDEAFGDLDLSLFEAYLEVPIADGALGVEFDYLDLSDTNGVLPDRLIDAAVAYGTTVGDFDTFGRMWTWGLAGGVGHASDSFLEDEHGWYGVAAVAASTSVGDVGRLTLGLDYDGNRVILPDVPIPVVAYATPLSETVFVTLGFPVNAVTWRPDDRWTLNATLIGINGRASVAYDLLDRPESGGASAARLYAALTADTLAAHAEDDDDHRRVFYERSTAEAGLRLMPTGSPGPILVLAGGYAFDQSFERGFDLRDTDTLLELDDAPYVRLSLALSF